MAREWRIVGCKTGAPPGDPCVRAIPIWSSVDDTPLGLASVAGAVRELLVFAGQHPDDRFVLEDEHFLGRHGMAARHYMEMFRVRPDNVVVPEAWDAQFPRVASRGRIRLIVAGSRSFADDGFMAQRLSRLCERFSAERILGISGGARGADEAGERWFAQQGIECLRFEAHWEWADAPRAYLGDHKGRPYNKRAGTDRNAKMAVCGTHLAAFVPGDRLTAGTASMVKLATRMGLKVRIASPLGRLSDRPDA